MTLDNILFYGINNLAGRHGGWDGLGIFAAIFLLPLLGLMLVLAAFTVKRLREEHWYELPLKALMAGAVAYAARFMLGVIVARPRPFLSLADTHLLVSREMSYSFPSGHAAVAFAFAFTVWRHDRDWGAAFLLLAALVAAGRVFVGVHYPLDALVGALVGWAAARTVEWLERREWGKIARRMRVR